MYIYGKLRATWATWVGDVATRRLHHSTCTPAPGTGTQDGAERLKNSVMLKKRTCYLSTSSPKSLESSEITARWCPKMGKWASISTTFPSAKKKLFRPGVLSRVRCLGLCDNLRCRCRGRSRFGHSEVATPHRNGDKPGKKFRR
jgi:hypothetical protein